MNKQKLKIIFRFQFIDTLTREKIEKRMNDLLLDSSRKHIFQEKINNLLPLLKNSNETENHLISNILFFLFHLYSR